MTRIIKDAKNNLIGEVHGKAAFAPKDDRLRLDEEGILRIDGAAYPASRVWLWAFPEQSRIEVYYEDGRFFHGFSAQAPQAKHICGEDHYDVTYNFGECAWSSEWCVKGRNKNYIMTTHYLR